MLIICFENFLNFYLFIIDCVPRLLQCLKEQDPLIQFESIWVLSNIASDITGAKVHNLFIIFYIKIKNKCNLKFQKIIIKNKQK